MLSDNKLLQRAALLPEEAAKIVFPYLFTHSASTRKHTVIN